MGRTRLARQASKVESPALFDTGRRSVRLRQQKLHEVKNGARNQKKVRGRNAIGKGVEKQIAPVETITIDLEMENMNSAPKAKASLLGLSRLELSGTGTNCPTWRKKLF